MTAIVLANSQFPIQTVAPSNIELGEVMVSADKRNSKDNATKLTDAERIRRVVLPATHWQQFHAELDGSKSQSLTDILRNALREIANDRLRDMLAEAPMANVVDGKDYTVSALLAWSEETANSRGSITFTREQVEEWFKQSHTSKQLVAKWAAASKTPEQIKQLAEFAAKRFATLAAKNHGLKDGADADKLLSLIAPEDAESGVGADIVGRIAYIQKAMKEKENESKLSMDDL